MVQMPLHPSSDQRRTCYRRTSRILLFSLIILTTVLLTTLFKQTLAEAFRNMTIEPLETFVIDSPALLRATSSASSSATAAAASPEIVIIWLHGLGADGRDFEEVIPLLRLPEHMRIRFVFPHAPVVSVTVNLGMLMPAWYNLTSTQIDKHVDYAGIDHSSRQLVKLIKSQNDAGVPSERILLAGFSQGGVIAYHTALRYPKPLAGLIALSTYLPTLEQIEQERSAANAQLPVFASHGTADTVVPYRLGVKARDDLIRLGYPVEWHEYPIPHQMSFEQIEKISTFIQRVYNQPRSRTRN